LMGAGGLVVDGGVLWRDDGTSSEPLSDPASRNVGVEETPVEDNSPLTELTDWLRQGKDIATAAAVAFGVLSKNKL
jgi:hypothetical protein